jgi:transcription elongation factor Elf1
MSQESNLNREFTKRDVNRLRNIITKKYGETTATQTGYNKQLTDHVESDTWEENGKTWTIKNGLKQSVTKLDKFKQLSLVPLLCPECNHLMKTPFDKKMYQFHKKCSNCVIEFETKLKINGGYKEYAQSIIDGNIQHFLKEYEEFLDDISLNINTGFVSEDGVVEKWIGDNKEQIKDAKKRLADIRKSGNSN